MIEEPALLTVKKPTRRPDAAQIAAFQGVATGFFVDALMGGGALSSNIQPLPGLSETVWSATVFYDYEAFSAHMNVRYRDEFIQRNGHFDGPGCLVRVCRDVPSGIPAGLLKARFACPPSVVDG